jgi:colanic acid biosynthesis glycosyl transferase WcaI
MHLVEDGPVLRMARRLELAAYESASQIVVVSQAFAASLRGKGVPDDKLTVVYNPATHRMPRNGSRSHNGGPAQLLSMGNIGHSQGLLDVVRQFQDSVALSDVDLRFVIAGEGVQADAVRDAICDDRVVMPGLLPNDELGRELAHTTLGLVTQRHDIDEFNLPSKLMNFMACGVPVLAVVRPESETAALVRRARAGWIVDSGRPETFGPKLRTILGQTWELARRGQAGQRFARQQFTAQAAASSFESILQTVAHDR